jgi:hypothetical protein
MTKDNEKMLFIVKRFGRLANRIVLFANVIAFAEEKGYRVVNVSFHSYAHFFEGTDDTLLCAYPRKKCPLDLFGLRSVIYRWIRKSRILYQATYMLSKLLISLGLSGTCLTFLTDTAEEQPILFSSPAMEEKIEKAKIVLLSGWTVRDSGNVEKHAEKIRAFFTPIKKYADAIEARMDEFKEGCDLLVGVHIRQGDYRNWLGGSYYYSLEQYVHLMNGIQDLYAGRRIKFLLCSDSEARGEKFPGLTVAESKGTPLEDLYSLARCDMIMGPPSTFSQWASFYGNVPLWHVTDPNQSVKKENFTISSIGYIPGHDT